MDVQDKRIFICVAFNVPQDKKDPNIITTARLDAALPTVEGALNNAEPVVDVEGKRTFVCVDFNVPQDKHDPNIIPNEY